MSGLCHNPGIAMKVERPTAAVQRGAKTPTWAEAEAFQTSPSPDEYHEKSFKYRTENMYVVSIERKKLFSVYFLHPRK